MRHVSAVNGFLHISNLARQRFHRESITQYGVSAANDLCHFPNVEGQRFQREAVITKAFPP